MKVKHLLFSSLFLSAGFVACTNEVETFEPQAAAPKGYEMKDLKIGVVNGGLEADAETTVYGIETSNIDKEFVCRYNKFYMSAGELQKTFSVGENENLILPKDSFEEVSLHYHNGSTCNYLMDELKGLMMAKNDIVSVSDYLFSDGVTKAFIVQFGYRSMFGLDVSEVESFDVRRASANTAFEFILIDTLKN